MLWHGSKNPVFDSKTRDFVCTDELRLLKASNYPLYIIGNERNRYNVTQYAALSAYIRYFKKICKM
jgi:hypothetical protein